MPLQIRVGFLLLGFLAAPLLAQTQIGGGTCSSSSLTGTYAVTLSGRQVSNAGTFNNVLQSNGIATFDGLSVVTITLSQDTIQAVATPVTWPGTYSVQADCVAAINITSTGGPTFNVMLYNQGKNFLLTGSDATYTYSGNGNNQPPSPTCSTSTLNGVYTFNATGFTLSSNVVSGVGDGAGLLQFDGQGNVTLNLTSIVGNTSSASTAFGSYSIAANCMGSATLTDSNSHSLVMSLSLSSTAATNTNFFASLARASNFLMTGAAHTAYAQSTPPSGQTITGGTCSTSELQGTYSLALNGRGISNAGAFTGSYQSIGTASFDGQGNVTLTGIANTNLAQGQTFSFNGTYSVPSNCSGTLNFTSSQGAEAFTLVVWSGGAQYAMVGSDPTYISSGSGGRTQLPACANSSLSGEYTFTASGFTLTGTAQTGSQDEAGVLQFDGQGNVTAKYTDTQSGVTPVTITATGNYSVQSNCVASATLGDSSGKSNALDFVIAGPFGQNIDLLAASSQFVRTGAAHSAWVNPSQSIGNVASYAYSSTPPGSVFVIFGLNLATRTDQAVVVPLPGKLLDTTVTVNGESAPLFFVSTGQIDAQMPWDIPGNAVASVIVTNGTSISNAAAVYVPATGTPGIASYSNNRASVVNADGTVNSGAAPAKVGEEVAVYFTGGGPVISQVRLITGDASPGGLSRVNADNSVTVGDVEANVIYMGLTPGSVGLYQANFIVPQIAKGTCPVVITIAGQASNNPVMTVSN